MFSAPKLTTDNPRPRVGQRRNFWGTGRECLDPACLWAFQTSKQHPLEAKRDLQSNTIRLARSARKSRASVSGRWSAGPPIVSCGQLQDVAGGGCPGPQGLAPSCSNLRWWEGRRDASVHPKGFHRWEQCNRPAK